MSRTRRDLQSNRLCSSIITHYLGSSDWMMDPVTRSHAARAIAQSNRVINFANEVSNHVK